MKPAPIGVDIAKHVFQVYYVDEQTGEIVNKQIRRAKFLEFDLSPLIWSLRQRLQFLARRLGGIKRQENGT